MWSHHMFPDFGVASHPLFLPIRTWLECVMQQILTLLFAIMRLIQSLSLTVCQLVGQYVIHLLVDCNDIKHLNVKSQRSTKRIQPK